MTDPDPARLDTRGRILQAALVLFTEKGYFNTSVQDISRASEVSVGSIYHHLGDKEGVARALFQSLTGRMETVIRQISSDHGSVHDRARALIRFLFDLTEAEPHVMEYMLHAKHREFLMGQAPICSSKPFEMMRDMVKEGINQGELVDVDTVVASNFLFGGPIRMITFRLDGLLPKPLPEYIDEVWSCAWRAVART